MITDLYKRQKATIRHGGLETKPTQIKTGVRQGCMISPCLFNLYSEEMMKVALEEKGVRINETKIRAIKLPDYRAIIATNRRDLRQMLVKINEIAKEYGMKINLNKTKCMTISKHPKNEH